MGSSAQSHCFITGALTFPLSVALLLTGADTFTQACQELMEELCLAARAFCDIFFVLGDTSGNGFSEAKHGNQMCVRYFLLLSVKVGLFSECHSLSSISKQHTTKVKTCPRKINVSIIYVYVTFSCFIFLSKMGCFPAFHRLTGSNEWNAHVWARFESIPAYLGGFPGKRACPPPLCGEISTELGQKVASSPVGERHSASSSKLIDSELIGK